MIRRDFTRLTDELWPEYIRSSVFYLQSHSFGFHTFIPNLSLMVQHKELGWRPICARRLMMAFWQIITSTSSRGFPPSYFRSPLDFTRHEARAITKTLKMVKVLINGRVWNYHLLTKIMKEMKSLEFCNKWLFSLQVDGNKPFRSHKHWELH